MDLLSEVLVQKEINAVLDKETQNLKFGDLQKKIFMTKNKF